MKNTALEKLFFSIEIIDKVTKPGGRINKTLAEIEKTARSGFMSLGKGALSIGGTVAALNSFTGPARNFNNAIKEVSALDVPQAELKALGKEAKNFSMKYGGAAADVVRAGYDIQSSIAGLNNGELAKFTYNSAVLAKATKADTATITGYVSTMSGAFEKDMNRMGKAEWMDQLTGKTARSVQMFRTTGREMQAMFGKFGGKGSSLGISMDEQMAVAGMLQKITGSGSEAATQYSAFLDGMAGAQKKLGLSFVDSHGQMLPMADILDKIRDKFGATIDVAESAQLKNAFGSKEAVNAITNILDKTGALKNNIAELGKVKGMDTALKMAKIQTDPLEKFFGILEVIRINLGQAILPTLNVFFGVLGSGLKFFVQMMKWFPPLKWAIAGVVIAISALSVALGTLWIYEGVGKLLSAFKMKLGLINALMVKSRIYTRNMSLTQKIAAVSTWLYHKSISGVTGALKFLRLNLLWSKTTMLASAIWTKVLAGANWFMNTSFMAATGSVWAFTAALLANPITWVVVGIMAAIGAIYLLVKHWDWVKSAFGSAIDFIADNWQWLAGWMLGPITGTIGMIVGQWDNIVSAAIWCFDQIKGLWNGLWGFGKNIVSSLFGWIVKKIESFLGWMTHLPIIGGKVQGALDKMKAFAGVEVNQTKIEQPTVSAVTESRNRDIAAGGIRNSTSNRTTNYGGVTIHTSHPVGPGEMEEMWALA